MLVDIVNNNSEILIISETKLDSSFPNRQIHIHGISEPSRFHINGKNVGILLHNSKGITSKSLLSEMTIEEFFVEINLRKKVNFFRLI